MDLKEYYQEQRLKSLGLDSNWMPEDDVSFGRTRVPTATTMGATMTTAAAMTAVAMTAAAAAMMMGGKGAAGAVGAMMINTQNRWG